MINTYEDLHKLADHIDTLIHRGTSLNLTERERDNTRFNLRSWVFDCGMPACAGGHACILFPDRLEISNMEDFTTIINIPLSKITGIGAFAKAFGIEDEHALRICLTSHYPIDNPPPAMVSKRIRKVADKYKNKNTIIS